MGIIPTNLDMSGKEKIVPIFDNLGNMIIGSVAIFYSQDHISVIAPVGARGMRIAPSLYYHGYCPACGNETEAIHFIPINEEGAVRQADVCSTCGFEHRSNPEIWPEVIVIYDSRLDGQYINKGLTKEFLQEFRNLIIEHYKETIPNDKVLNEEQEKYLRDEGFSKHDTKPGLWVRRVRRDSEQDPRKTEYIDLRGEPRTYSATQGEDHLRSGPDKVLRVMLLLTTEQSHLTKWQESEIDDEIKD